MFNWLKKISPVSENLVNSNDAVIAGEGSATMAPLPNEYTTYKKRGNELLAQGRLKEAALCYRQAVATNPGYAEGFLNLGFVLEEEQQHAEAELALKQAVLLNPKMEDAYYLLATVLQASGKPKEAIDNYNMALELKPDFEIVYRDLILALFQNEQPDQAEVAISKAIGLYPLNADFHYYLGKLYAYQGETDKAIDSFLKALSIQPGFAEGHNDMGLALQAQNRIDAAVQSFRKALSCKQDYAEAHCNLGTALQSLGQLEAAIASYQNAIAINPDYAIAHNNLASALQKQDKLEEAIKHLHEAIKINPRYAEAHCNLGVALKIQGKLEAAIKCFQMSLSINPDSAEAHSNLADTFQALGKLDAAIEQYQQTVSLQPDSAKTHHSLGLVFVQMGKQDRAVQCFQKALSVDPDYADAHLSLGLSQLLLGNFEQGWAEYEWRWQVAHMQSAKFNCRQPLWLGKEPLSGKTILLHFEQGFGDAIQFSRYAKFIAARGATVLLFVPAALKSLLTGLEGVTQVLAENELLPAFDYHCPLMSLPLAFSTRLNTIPAEGAYLGCDQEHISKWQDKLGNKTRPRIGLVWAGNRTHQNDINRSIPLQSLIGILSDQVQWVVLQKEICPSDQALLSKLKHVACFDTELEDFMDTAGLIANMDLVISVDTAVAHLACAMGKPVWILLPVNTDWRWMLGRSDSPWYPSARLFRQTMTGDWDSVLSLVAKELIDTIGV